jgi:cation transport ATPase
MKWTNKIVKFLSEWSEDVEKYRRAQEANWGKQHEGEVQSQMNQKHVGFLRWLLRKLQTGIENLKEAWQENKEVNTSIVFSILALLIMFSPIFFMLVFGSTPYTLIGWLLFIPWFFVMCYTFYRFDVEAK